MHTLVVSDLHIDAAQASIGERFLAFLDGAALKAQALYVLGDLFESWIGDDEDDAHRLAVLAGLERLSRAGVALYCMAGNRDFLYGKRFAERTGATLLDDPTIVTRYGQRVLLTHGDALCTDDVPYQRLRAMVRDGSWQHAFLSLPRQTRALMANAARSGSQTHTAQQAPMLMDVNAQAVQTLLDAAGVETLLHGHTHRPGRHELLVAGRDCTRLVLSDWSREPIVAQWDATGIRLLPLCNLDC